MLDRSFLSHLVGYPRIGPNRELKRALEGRWSGRLKAEEFRSEADRLHSDHLAEQDELIGAATDDFFLYDEAVETAMMLGATPEWAHRDDDFDSLTALTRGTSEHEAWEMTKWFDTNYHYVVPELQSFDFDFKPLWWRQPKPNRTWVVLGPYSLIKLSKTRSNHLQAAAAAQALWSWLQESGAGTSFSVQLDEPFLGIGGAGDMELVASAYRDVPQGIDAVISVQFGRPQPNAVSFLGERGLSVQLPARHLEDYGDVLGTQPELFVSVMDGRSIWPDDPRPSYEAIRAADAGSRLIRLSPTTSLMFLPYTTEGEDLPDGFQFAREKAATLKTWTAAFSEGHIPTREFFPVPDFPEIAEPQTRASRAERRRQQADLDLPPLPTTTTGSLPQTRDVRRLRFRLSRGELDLQSYEEAVDEHVRDAISWQEGIGLDVLVHGEFERSDMVEYFAEQMDGYLTTRAAWVLSYGSRCIRPPILAAPPTIDHPMTVREWKVARSATDKPVKGMLTGPVTIVNWSFRPPGVDDDRLFWAVAKPIAAEVASLVEAGARIIQIDEPAVRERWPLETPDVIRQQEIYSRGVRAALNLVFNAPSQVQMHTHMCYGDFGDIVPLWNIAGVDVASIEFSRSKDDSYIRLFYNLYQDGHLQIGPGVFDVHSPHSPGAGLMHERLEYFLQFMESTDVWVNPDCGLKTRSWDEISTQLSDMVKAADAARSRILS